MKDRQVSVVYRRLLVLLSPEKALRIDGCNKDI
jgi:hypothetical protein